MNKRFTLFKKFFYWPLLAAIFFPLSLFSADEKPPAIAEMWVVEVDSKDFGAFEEAFKKHMKYRESKGDPRKWQIYTPHTGEKMNRYIIRSCCFKWPEMDAYVKWSQDSKASENWNKGAGQFAKSYAHHYSWIDHENGNWPNDGKPFKFVGVRTFKVKHGANASEGVKAISKVAKDMGWKERWGWAYSMSGPSTVSLVFPFENFADMTPPSPSFGEAAGKHLGSKEKLEELFDDFDGNFKGSTYIIYNYRSDLSSKMDK